MPLKFGHQALWQFAAVLLLLCVFGTVSDARDSAEVVAVGRCLWQVDSCAGWDWTYRPPLPPLLAALFPFKGSAGVVLVSMLATAAWVFPARRLLQGEGAGWAFALLIAATPGIRTAAMVGDPRSLGVLALLGATAAVAEKRWFLAGLLAGVAALCRVENLVATGCVVLVAAASATIENPGIAGVRGRLLAGGRAALWVLGGSALAILPWTTAISAKIGRFTFVSRTWEGAAAEWSETLTLPLIHLWVGPSAWEGPLRDALRSQPPTTTGLEITTIGPALWGAAALAVPDWLAAGVIAAALLLAFSRRAVWPLAAAVAILSGPTLLSLATRPGRESPEASIVPLLASLALIIDLGIGRLQSTDMSRRRAKRSMLVPMGVGLWALWAASGLFFAQTVPPRERTAASVALAKALIDNPAQTPVGAVFATAQIAREGGRDWLPLDGRNVPAEIILAQGDDPWAVLGLLVPPTVKVRVSERFGGEGWAALLTIEPNSATLKE